MSECEQQGRKAAAKKWWASYRSSVQIHRVWLFIWIALVPVSLLLKDNVAWVVFMSHWAILSGEASAVLAGKSAEEASDEMIEKCEKCGK